MLQLPYLQEDNSEAFPQGPLKGLQRVELQWLVVVAQSLMHVSLAFLLSHLIYFTISQYFLESFSPPPNKLLISKPCLKLSLDPTRWWWYIVIWNAHLWNRSFKKQYLVQSIEWLWYFLFLSLLLDTIHWSDLMTHSWVSACSLKTTIPDGGHVNTWVLVIRAIWQSDSSLGAQWADDVSLGELPTAHGYLLFIRFQTNASVKGYITGLCWPSWHTSKQKQCPPIL